MERYKITAETAARVREWLQEKGAVQIWKSINLSNPGTEWLTPGENPKKPNWQCGPQPSRVMTGETEFLVQIPVEVKRFHVATRWSGNGLSIKVTDGGNRRINAAVAKAAEKYGDAWYEFDYWDYNNAVIMAAGETVPMEDWGYKKDIEPNPDPYAD